jgi:SpoVK/Ycf46/Vps4 family AAA+-type ATPase
MEPEETLRVAIVEVHRRDGILFLDEFDMLLEEASTYGRQDDFLTLLETVDGIVVLATNRGARLPQALDRRILHRLCFKPPNRGEREEIWRLLMPPGCHPTGGELQRLASFPITGGYIKNSILYALQRATTLDEPIGFEHLLESARESRRRMSHAIREHTSVSMLYDENACEHLVVTPAMEACLEQFRKLEQPSITAARELVADRGLRIWLRTSDLDLARRIALWLGRRLHMPCIVPDRHLVERSLPDDSVSHALFDQWAGRSIMLIRTHTNQRDIYGESLRKQLSGWVRDAGIHVIMAGIPPDEDLQEWAGLFHRIITMEERGSASLEYLESLVARSGLRLSDEAVALLYRRRPCTHEQRCVFLRLIEESTGPEVSGELMAGVLEEVSLKPRNEGRLFGAEKRRG